MLKSCRREAAGMLGVMAIIAVFVLMTVLLACRVAVAQDNVAELCSLKTRRKTYESISQALSSLNDTQLEDLLKTATHVSTGYGQNCVLQLNGMRVFIKKIPLTDLELKPENVQSTANMFKLPLWYQYGIGSAGFGAWRELEAHKMATDWVLSGACENFPLMYHWRVVPGKMSREGCQRDIDEAVAYWDNSETVRARLEAMAHASSFLVLFLEYIPQTLDVWLTQQFKYGSDVVDLAVIMIEKNLNATASFMAASGMHHFDAHFENILTDGVRLYFGDMGLAVCSTFDLSPDERIFFEQHRLYDTSYVKAALASELLSRITSSRKKYKRLRQEYAQGRQDILYSATVTDVLKRCAPHAQVLHSFLSQLRKGSKQTPYPVKTVERVCNAKHE